MINTLEERIAQFRKMANDDPTNDLAHFRLGQLLMENGQHEEAVKVFHRTLELFPQFSKVFQLQGMCLIKLGRRAEAIQVLRDGFKVADERGDNIPRRDGPLAGRTGGTRPTSQKTTSAATVGPGGFQCLAPGCLAGALPINSPGRR